MWFLSFENLILVNPASFLNTIFCNFWFSLYILLGFYVKLMWFIFLIKPIFFLENKKFFKFLGVLLVFFSGYLTFCLKLNLRVFSLHGLSSLVHFLFSKWGVFGNVHYHPFLFFVLFMVCFFSFFHFLYLFYLNDLVENTKSRNLEWFFFLLSNCSFYLMLFLLDKYGSFYKGAIFLVFIIFFFYIFFYYLLMFIDFLSLGSKNFFGFIFSFLLIFFYIMSFSFFIDYLLINMSISMVFPLSLWIKQIFLSFLFFYFLIYLMIFLKHNFPGFYFFLKVILIIFLVLLFFYFSGYLFYLNYFHYTINFNSFICYNEELIYNLGFYLGRLILYFFSGK